MVVGREGGWWKFSVPQGMWGGVRRVLGLVGRGGSRGIIRRLGISGILMLGGMPVGNDGGISGREYYEKRRYVMGNIN